MAVSPKELALGMGFAAVKPAHDLILQPVSLRWVFSLDHLVGQTTQLLRGEPAALNYLPCQIDDFDWFFSRQLLDGLNDFDRCHK